MAESGTFCIRIRIMRRLSCRNARFLAFSCRMFRCVLPMGTKAAGSDGPVSIGYWSLCGVFEVTV